MPKSGAFFGTGRIEVVILRAIYPTVRSEVYANRRAAMGMQWSAEAANTKKKVEHYGARNLRWLRCMAVGVAVRAVICIGIVYFPAARREDVFVPIIPAALNDLSGV